MRLWEAWTGKALGTFAGHTNAVQSVAWSPDGTRLASGSYDHAVRLWEAGTGKALGTFEGHTDWVQSVAWSPDGTRLASGSSDNTVRLWEAGTGKPLAVLRGHLGPVYSVSWNRDGRFLVSSGSDGTLRIWDAATGHCLAVYVATPDGAVVYRPSDGHYRTQGDPAGRVAYTIGLARYELGELDELVEGGLRLPEGEPLVPL